MDKYQQIQEDAENIVFEYALSQKQIASLRNRLRKLTSRRKQWIQTAILTVLMLIMLADWIVNHIFSWLLIAVMAVLALMWVTPLLDWTAFKRKYGKRLRFSLEEDKIVIFQTDPDDDEGFPSEVKLLLEREADIQAQEHADMFLLYRGDDCYAIPYEALDGKMRDQVRDYFSRNGLLKGEGHIDGIEKNSI